MNFSSVEKINSSIDNIQSAELLRANQRALLNTFFNGSPPYTQQEASQNKIHINFNDKAGQTVLHQARGQYENAFLKMANFFAVTVDCPPDKQAEWSSIITKKINQRLKKSRPYLHSMRSKFAGVVLHGIGAQMWPDDEVVIPFCASIQDIGIPTDTELTMENLRYFYIRRRMRPGELFRKAILPGKNVREGWNVPMITKLLDEYKELNSNPNSYDWANNPEGMQELYKQNLTYYENDSSPVVWVNDFYFKEDGEGNKPGWYRRMVLDKDNRFSTRDVLGNEFIYAPKLPFASSLDQIIHFQFGDGNNVPPFMYHSVRSLAYMLYELMWTMNRLNCQFTQHVFEQLMTWFRVQDPSDRGRLDKIHMAPPYAIVPNGLGIVNSNERYKVDYNLVNTLQSQYRQRISEVSSAYTQQVNDGTQKERTKFETEAILSQISSFLSTMLTLAYNQEYFAYEEICRRITKPNSNDFLAKHVRSECIQAGVPAKYFNAERWNIRVEQVLGGGNKMLELAQARELYSMKPGFGPDAQRQVDRIRITALTDNAALAEELVPRAPTISDSVHDAQNSFGTLMLGISMEPMEGFNHVEQVQTLLNMMAQVVQRIQQSGGVGTQQEVIGLQNVAEYIEKHIQIIAQDPNDKAIVKMFQDSLNKLMNFAKAFAQRQQEAAQASQQTQQNQLDPETIAKIKGMMLMDQTKARAKDAQTAQRLRHNEAKFQQQERLKGAKTVTDLNIQTGKALANTALNGLKDGSLKTPFSE